MPYFGNDIQFDPVIDKCSQKWLHFFVIVIFIIKILMQVESRKNKNAKRLNSVRGTQRFTKPSQTNGGANIRINSETTIPKLKNLAKKYIGVSNPYGFLTDLQNALGIPNSKAMIYYLAHCLTILIPRLSDHGIFYFIQGFINSLFNNSIKPPSCLCISIILI